MKTLLSITLLIFALSGIAYANHNDDGHDDNGRGNPNNNHNRNTNRNNQSQGQVQIQGQGQAQSTQNSNNAAQSTVVEMNTPRQAVPAGAVSAAGTTANCRVAGGVSVGAVWGGFGVSGSVLDENCAKIDLAKALIWAGMYTGDQILVDHGKALLMDALAALYPKVEAVATEVSPQ